MHYNYYFDICALCILGTLALTSLSRRWVPAYRQRAYSMLFLVTFLSTFSESVETYLQMNPVDAVWYQPAEMVLGSVYYIAHLGSGFFYLMYIMAVLDIYVDVRRLGNFMAILMGYVTGIVLVFINFFYPILFYYDEKGLYHRGKLIILFYILAFYYISQGIYLIFRYKKLMRVRTKAVVASYVFFILAALIIQYLFPTILIENMLTSISIALVYISLQNPSEMVDENLNILNRKAFLEGLDMKTSRSTAHATIFVTIDNVRALSDEMGYGQAQKVLKKVAGYLKKVGRAEFGLQTYAYRYSEYVFAVTVHTEDDNRIASLLHAIAVRLHEPWTFGNMAIRVEGHCFLMNYPDNYRTAAELMTKIELICANVSRELDSIIDVTKECYNDLKSITDFDDLARKNLDRKTCIIKFQPVLSKIYRINYSADFLCYFKDDYGNEVDMRGRIGDAQNTQALLEVDELVYRQACRALTFWNAGDKNGKYRAIVGLSQGEISRNDFIRRIKKILREERAEASWISIKLSETTVTTMNAVAERNLRLLGDMKSSIIVDRFGSGYGDLDRILTLPVTQVNIDHEILIKARESDRMKIVAQGIVNLFHDISIFVGASDIRTEEEKQMAEELGCDFLIGDHMGRPMKDSSYVRFIDAYFEEG